MTDVLDTHRDAWSARLHELVAELDVPGAVLGVSHRGERLIVPAGVAGLRHPAPVTADTAFQLGSISKLYTATLVLALAGLEILDAPVGARVPEAAWLEPEIRVEHLLTHSSGLGGDCFADVGRDDGCLARYVTGLAELPRDVAGPPGTRYSYCNSGYSVLGRLVEVLGEASFDDVLRARLLDPLGAVATSTLPEQTILRPAALGHNRVGARAGARAGDAPLTADVRWNLPRACGPLGGVCAPAGELLGFAELHLGDGRAADGTRVLGPGVAARMRERRLEAPPLSLPSARGLGFGLFDWRGGTLPGHDGETLGQIAKLRLSPERDLALVVLTNAIPDGGELARTLETEVLAGFGLEPPRLPPRLVDPDFDPRPYVGRYRNLGGTIEVSGRPGGLRVRDVTEAAGLEPSVAETALDPLGDGAFVDAADPAPTRVVRFADREADGRCGSLFGGRLAMRVD